jgi:hypothetical protein
LSRSGGLLGIGEEIVPDREIETYMAEMTAEQYRAIGHVAVRWSRLEADIATQLWRLADVQNGPGACLTAQIAGVSRLLDALISLVVFRGGSTALVAKLHKFSAKSHGLVEKRNRVIHDVWTFDPPGPIRHEVKAKGRLIWEERPEPAATVEAVAVEIVRHTTAFYDLAREIAAEQLMPSLRNRPAKRLSPRRQRPTEKSAV